MKIRKGIQEDRREVRAKKNAGEHLRHQHRKLFGPGPGAISSGGAAAAWPEIPHASY